jgi:hypothetical protein
MLAFTLYGLDANERAVSVEILKAETLNPDLRQLAYERLSNYPTVEVWSGPKRLLRVTQRGALRH